MDNIDILIYGGHYNAKGLELIGTTAGKALAHINN